jgi:hypothetical protein
MAKYMIRWNWPPEHRNEVIKRFTEGSAMQPPDGLSVVGRWHAAAGGGGWGVLETDDPKTIADWFLHWSDVLSYEATPVIPDEELGEMLQKHGLG